VLFDALVDSVDLAVLRGASYRTLKPDSQYEEERKIC
jgi:hypothetical protein